MNSTFTAPETREELLTRLSDSMTDDSELQDLVGFLCDDLAYAPTNSSIVGAVLRHSEFEPWQTLMAEVEGEGEPHRIRQLSRELLAKMQA